ncbi:MAG: hypothetical protein DIU60_022205 [Actinomycetes bacterium]|jgi:hypothetical protein|nr:MAG: hypothetical protein DIU60_22510 [Actinomycetota bacterium]
MLKKFAVFTAAAAVAGVGLASPAQAQEDPKDKVKDVHCVIADIGGGEYKHESGGLVYLLGSLGLYDLLSHRDIHVDCHVTQQINNNTHQDSHESSGRTTYRFRGRR